MFYAFSIFFHNKKNVFFCVLLIFQKKIQLLKLQVLKKSFSCLYVGDNIKMDIFTIFLLNSISLSTRFLREINI